MLNTNSSSSREQHPTDSSVVNSRLDLDVDPRMEHLADNVFNAIRQRQQKRVQRRQTLILQLICLSLAFAIGQWNGERTVSLDQSADGSLLSSLSGFME